ncbi:MAG: pseudouridine synthase [Thermodesulfobacteriota bacterium]|nr:pseudouridine synthase [Thermodesulfobacteriota bacterium]
MADYNKPMSKMRINRYIACCSSISRRGADSLIKAGGVFINSRQASIGDVVDTDIDSVTIDGKRISSQEKHYLAMYKPKFVVTTMNDPQGRVCIKDFIPQHYLGVFPVGRLDFDAQGLIILTNDGDFANIIHHPSFNIPKVYDVKVMPRATEGVIKKMRHGMYLDGIKIREAHIEKIHDSGNATYMKITLQQGIKNQIKRMAGAVRLHVISIKRISVGPVRLRGMKPGDIRSLTNAEIYLIHRPLKKHKGA